MLPSFFYRVFLVCHQIHTRDEWVGSRRSVSFFGCKNSMLNDIELADVGHPRVVKIENKITVKSIRSSMIQSTPFYTDLDGDSN